MGYIIGALYLYDAITAQSIDPNTILPNVQINPALLTIRDNLQLIAYKGVLEEYIAKVPQALSGGINLKVSIAFIRSQIPDNLLLDHIAFTNYIKELCSFTSYLII